MKRQKLLSPIMGLAIAACFTLSCSEENIKNNDDNGQSTPSGVTLETQLANSFAKEVLEYYYYWNEEIANDLKKLDPETNSDPISTVNEIRYHQGDKEIDKWTMLTNNMDEFTSSVGGVSTTYGYTPMVYRYSNSDNECFAAICFVYENSPAAKAGLKRGDLIYAINGNTLTTDNFTDLYYTSSIELSLAKLDGNTVVPTGKKVKMNAVEMYENPIICDSIYEFNGKKVGYLAYTSFDLNSIPQLIEISKKFKAEGIKELILDLRYNGGGYVITESAMASMYAPQAAVTNKEIFEKEDYNDFMTEMIEKEGGSTVTRFSTEYNFSNNGQNVSLSTKDANIGLEKIYGIITSNSASASEALLGGLMPYMDVELIGNQSHGKYCTGWMLAAEDAYQKVPEEIKNWGIYVMVSVYKNANDETPCMPDGMIPDVKAEDNPLQVTQIGDINEDMLKTALQQAGMVYEGSEKQDSRTFTQSFKSLPMKRNANFGKRIILPEKQILQLNQK